MKNKTLDLDNPEDAREFLTKAIPQVMPGCTAATLEDDSIIYFNNLSDSEAVQYAYELLPLYRSKFPELVTLVEIH